MSVSVPSSFDIDEFQQLLTQERFQALSYLMIRARTMPYDLLHRLMEQHFPRPRITPLVAEVEKLLKQERRKEARQLVDRNLKHFDMCDSGFLVRVIKQCSIQRADLSGMIHQLENCLHPDHFGTLCILANELARERFSYTALALQDVLATHGTTCRYTGNYASVCTACGWPCQSKCRECVKLLCHSCGNPPRPCLRNKVCFTIDIGETPDDTLPYEYGTDYYPGTYDSPVTPQIMGTLLVEEDDQLVVLSLATRKVVHEFARQSGPFVLVIGQSREKDVVTLYRPHEISKPLVLDEEACKTMGKTLQGGPFAVCSLETRLMLPKVVNTSKLVTSFGWDTSILTINSQVLQVKRGSLVVRRGDSAGQ